MPFIKHISDNDYLIIDVIMDLVEVERDLTIKQLKDKLNVRGVYVKDKFLESVITYLTTSNRVTYQYNLINKKIL